MERFTFLLIDSFVGINSFKLILLFRSGAMFYECAKCCSCTFRKALLFFIVWWIVWSCIEWYIITYYGINWKFALADSIINNGLLAFTFIAVFNSIKFYRPTRGNLLYVRIWTLLHALFITAINGWFISHLTQFNSEYVTFLNAAWPIRYVFNVIMICST